MEKPNGLWIPKKTNKESSSSSWEELAFAEDDAAGSLWPPRSYTCSFCQREFRSAQALGGHMNIHRRDRARLKQSEYHKDHDDIRQNSSYILGFNSKPNCFYKSQHSCVIDLSSSLSSLLYSTPSSRVSSSSSSLNRGSSPSFVVEHAKNSRKILPTSPWPCPRRQNHHDLYEISIMEGDKKRKIERDRPKTGHKAKVNLGNTIDLSMSMNLVIQQSFQNVHEGNEESGSVDITKRRRRHESPSHVSRLSCKGDIVTRNEEMIKTKGDLFDDLDLELRL